MSFCFLDTETFSAVPIQNGIDLYAQNVECLILTYAIGLDGPVKLWEPRLGPMPSDLAGAIADRACFMVAHNAPFDRLILERALGVHLPVQRWWCTRAQAYAHGLPGSLEGLGHAVGLAPDQAKRVEDGKLIFTFCVPAGTGGRLLPEDRPSEWARFCEYARQDTATLRAIFQRLPRHNWDGPGGGIHSWHLNQLMNRRGFQFDFQLARAALAMLEKARRATSAQVKALSGGEVEHATQVARLLAHLRKKYPEMASLGAAQVREWLEGGDLDPVSRLLLEARLNGAKSAGAKFARGLSMMSPDGRQRDTQQFNGAGRTGRDSGKGYQPHNMGRPQLTVRGDNGVFKQIAVKADYIDQVVIPGIYDGRALSNPLVYGSPYEACALAVRHAITAAPGNELVVGDWKNIESVVVAWLAGEEKELQAFREAFADPKDKTKDVYRIQFSQFFGTHPEDVTDNERQCGKVTKLAFGFGGGVGALVTMAAGYQLDLTTMPSMVLPRATAQQKEKAYNAWRRAFLRGEDYDLEPAVYQACDVLKQAYREANPRINALRKDLGAAVLDALEAPGSRAVRVGRCLVWSTGGALLIELPSGRRLCYMNPRITKEVIQEPEREPWVARTVSYATARGRSWIRTKAWDGLFVQNAVQAVANDVLRATARRVHHDTLEVLKIRAYLDTLPEAERTALVLEVHDEICLDVPVGSITGATLRELMCEPKRRFDTGAVWSEGLPLAADTWVNFRYGKR